ncbi:hypothetical protein [Stigmatella erecta]|uniref:Peptidase family C25 n=1 Tax=Stigmatella erecta TaxID=83460 RepID=A0A1I0KR15_9BACT|nr:hypothetical protein [Stigmatella erecta]SEU27978.1 hypothetical protein SAMN05443639_11385 [Stigmatella erecta]
MTLNLLMAHADDGNPVLQEALPVEALREAPIEPLEIPERLWNHIADQNLLTKQRWGVVAPKGPSGDLLLKLIAPLREKRAHDQGGVPVRIYRVNPGMDAPSSMRWKHQCFWSEDVDEEERPRYLLILGGLKEVSLELQQALATSAYVGRLAFDSEAGYQAYVSKVLHWERAQARESKARLLLYTAQDGSDAILQGHADLITPCLDACLSHSSTANALHLSDGSQAPGQALLTRAATPEPSILLSVSHGLGRPPNGWSSGDSQRALQGALRLPGQARLTGADLMSGAFLPGGVWFCFACFSAGTPAHSLYTPWVRQLAKTHSQMARVLASLPQPLGEEPFIAALPQAVLANPDGPLAVIGHVDLAWTLSFSAHGQRTTSRFFGVLRALAQGHRAGPSLMALQHFFNEMNMSLTARDSHAALETDRGRKVFASEQDHAYLWLQRQDLMGFILLGDPAVRLPVSLPPEES